MRVKAKYNKKPPEYRMIEINHKCCENCKGSYYSGDAYYICGKYEQCDDIYNASKYICDEYEGDIEENHEHIYWVNRTQLKADSWEEIEEKNEVWIVFKTNNEFVAAVRKSELFELKIDISNIVGGHGLCQDTLECKGWERNYPKKDSD